ncbi:MAG: cob(I)yrinic acid a,c-diamide adenosyltransferase, partial [Candidatus Marinimicrobia bacterium]|nr:cob(I)yrinic acid a,c-diamide adenosyltransferase [Candidatus Neomarinimicrobiota bacterium]
WKISMLQFMKGTWKYGELFTAEKFSDLMEIIPMGKGFYKILDDNSSEEEHREAALSAFKLGIEKIKCKEYNLVVLDEILVAIQTGLIEEDIVINGLENIRDNTHVILTGRGATDKLIKMADLVTEMTEIKHPFTSGKMALKGIDF